VESPLGRGDADQAEQFDRLVVGVRLADLAVGPDRLGDRPTRIVGLSERAGSWNTIASSLPRCLRSWPSDSPISSLPRSRAEPLTAVPAGSRPMMARQPTVLPDPDSPMIARVRPASTR